MMDRVRVDQTNKLKQDKKARQWVKRSRWVLLEKKDNLNTQQGSYLTEILNMNQDLMTTYLLGAQLKELWRCESELQAKNLLQVQWEQVNESGIKPLKEFARKPRHRGFIFKIIASIECATRSLIKTRVTLIAAPHIALISVGIKRNSSPNQSATKSATACIPINTQTPFTW